MNKYTGHPNQTFGVEEMRLCGGKGDGMRMLYVRNGNGLDFWISVDRCADISRLSFKGYNFGYFAPCGYVSHQYYDDKESGFLKSFTAGFITTCGMRGVGTPCVDNGEEVPLHGNISNIPCENVAHWTDTDGIHIKAIIRDAEIFSYKLILEREYIISLEKNEINLCDVVKNIGSKDSPLEILYHCNMGYPLLDEHAEISIPSSKVVPRNEHAAAGLEDCLKVESPQNGYEEMCFYHTLSGQSEVSIFNSKIKIGLTMSYDTKELKYFTQWKMMGETDYVMGLEPGNCLPDGRKVMRENGMLDILKQGESRTFHLKFTFMDK